jgi:hypothetical protein
MHPILRPNRQRAQYAVYGLYIAAAGTLASAISAFMQYRLLNGFNIGIVEAEANDRREQLIAILNGVLFVANAILFILWFRRAYFNLHQIPGATPTHSEGWAAGAWFVPLLNLVRPYQIGNEIFRQSKEQAGESDNNNTLPGMWWASFIIMNFAANISVRWLSDATTGDELSQATIFSMVVDGLSFISIFLAIRYIKTTSRYEEKMQQGLLVDEIGKEAEEEGQTI